MQERELNNTLYTFTNIPLVNKAIQRICLCIEHLILKNIPALDKIRDNNLGAMLPINPAKNTLLLGLSVTMIRVRYLSQDISKYKNNIIVNRLSIQKEIKRIGW